MGFDEVGNFVLVICNFSYRCPRAYLNLLNTNILVDEEISSGLFVRARYHFWGSI